MPETMGTFETGQKMQIVDEGKDEKTLFLKFALEMCIRCHLTGRALARLHPEGSEVWSQCATNQIATNGEARRFSVVHCKPGQQDPTDGQERHWKTMPVLTNSTCAPDCLENINKN